MSWSYLWSILFISLHAMVPITLTAVGEIFGETAGLFNIGLEGILLISAFTGTMGAEAGGATVGLLVGMGTGAIISLIFSVINTYWKGNQMITGIGINLFALGFVAFGLIVLGAQAFMPFPRRAGWSPSAPLLGVSARLSSSHWLSRLWLTGSSSGRAPA